MAPYRTRDARGASSTNDCRDPAMGAIDPWAQDLVDRVGSYTGKMADQKIGLAGGGAGKAQRDDRLGAIDHAVVDIPVTAGLIRGLPGCEVFGDSGLAAFIRERGISSIDEVALFHAISENIAMGIVVRAENILRRSREIVLRVAQKLSWHKTLREQELAELLAGVEVAR